MAKIVFNAGEVSSTIEGFSEITTSLVDKIEELNSKKDNLSSFWSAKEATAFANQLAKVQTNLSKFMEKYEGYLSLLNSVLTSYQTDEAAFLATIKSIAVEAQEGSNSN